MKPRHSLDQSHQPLGVTSSSNGRYPFNGASQGESGVMPELMLMSDPGNEYANVALASMQRLDHVLDLLTSGDRDLPLRQRTLRATISWSYSLLTPDEQRLLRRLSVFHEGWTLDALERVCYGDVFDG